MESKLAPSDTTNLENSQKNSKLATILRTSGVVVIISLIVALIIFNTPKTKSTDEVWDARATIGSPEAKNHYIMYTDLMCPYCDYFSRAIMSSQSDFEQYLADHDVLYEMRITDFLYEYNGVSEYSTDAAVATYCAMNEDRFWDYYHAAMTALNDDYHSKGIGNSKTAPRITDMTRDYWNKIGLSIGLGDTFETCYKNQETLALVQANTKQTAKDLTKYQQSGLPFFKFNDFTTSGFDSSWGWDYVKMYFDSGLNKN